MTRALLAVALLAGCGGSSTSTTCDGTVMGALMGTFSTCNDFDQRYRANLDTYSFTAGYTELPTSFTWTTAWEVKGEPKTKSYLFTGDPDNDTAGISCNVTMKKSGKSWLARTGAGVPGAGTCSLTLNEVTANDPIGNVTTYQVRGTVAAHLEAEPGTGSTGTVDVTMDFCTGDAVMCPALMR